MRLEPEPPSAQPVEFPGERDSRSRAELETRGAHGMIPDMQATRVLLIRHGETDWNVTRRVQGQLDLPLNPTGQRQARQVAAALADGDPIDTIYSSDLLRTMATARAIAETTGSPLVSMAALRERNLGTFQGSTFAEVTTRAPADAASWRSRVPDWVPPGGGESLLQFRERTASAVLRIARENAGRQIAVVTHGGVLDILYREATRLALQDARTWEIGNAAINRILWTNGGRFSLVGWNDTSHLSQEPSDEPVR